MPKKVLQLCAVDFTLEKLLKPLVRRMEECGYEVVSGAAPGAYMDQWEKEGKKVIRLPMHRGFNPIKHLKSIFVLTFYLRREKFDAVHTHSPIASLVGRIACFLARVPVVVYTAHGFYFHDQMKPWVYQIVVWLEKMSGHLTDFLFTQSEEDAESAVKLGIMPSSKVLVIGNGVDTKKFNQSLGEEVRLNTRNSLGIKDDQIVITIIARIVREKGYGELMEAAKILKKNHQNLVFLVIGSTLESDRDGFQAEVDEKLTEYELNDSFQFLESRKDIPELLAASDIFTLPSYREGMPRSIIEAMHMGLPVVATEIRGCREEVITHQTADDTRGPATGFLVPAKNSQLLANSLDILIKDPELRQEMGKAGAQRAKKLYDESQVLNRQIEVFDRLLGDPVEVNQSHFKI